jgi:Na+-translocating ferredoxin:NAD+ oxidoreductase subunit G
MSAAAPVHPRGPAAPPSPPAEVPAWRLVGTLGAAGALAGLLIVTVFHATQPRILAHQARVLASAVDEVLAGPERVQRWFVHAGALTDQPPEGVDTLRVERVFQGFDASGASIGFALTGREPGFADAVSVIFGYDPRERTVLGMRVLESRETPGLGDKIEKDRAWVESFRGTRAPLSGVKPARATGADDEVHLITGATISSRVVVSIINNRIEALHPLLVDAPTGGRR